MSVIDIESLLADVSPDMPCGEDPSYDATMMALETAIQPPAAGIIASEDPEQNEEQDWPSVRKLATELLLRSKHLRPVVYLALAAAKTAGPEGLRDGLALLRGLIERHWDHVHPQLDPDDGNDPTERLNIIGAIATPLGTYGDTLGFLSAIRSMPLIESRQIGRFNFKDLALSAGRVAPAEGQTAVEPALIQGIFKEADPDMLRARVQTFTQALEHVEAIEQALTERVGIGQAISLAALTATLREVHRELTAHLPASMQDGAAVANGEAAAGNGHDGTGPTEAAAPAMVMTPGAIATREDVVRVLDSICDYYAKHEPSSPLPLFIKRAKKMVYMDFVDIIRELTPDAMERISMLMGIDESDAQR